MDVTGQGYDCIICLAQATWASLDPENPDWNGTAACDDHVRQASDADKESNKRYYERHETVPRLL